MAGKPARLRLALVDGDRLGSQETWELDLLAQVTGEERGAWLLKESWI